MADEKDNQGAAKPEPTTESNGGKELLQATIDSSLDVIQLFKAVKNKQGRIIDFVWVMHNRKGFEQNGDVIGESLIGKNPGVVTTGIFEKMVYVAETGVAIEHEQFYTYEQFDGWFYQALVKSGDDVVMTTRDITSQKKALEEIVKLKEEIAQRATDKYYSIFDSIEEGFCIYEVIYDENGIPSNLKWIEVNPAYEKQTGLKNVVGKLHSDIPLDTESYWFDMYDKVIKTGVPVRFEDWHKPTGRWYHTYASRIGGEGNNQVAVLFDDITERKTTERNLAFLAEVSLYLVGLRDTEETMNTLSKKMGEFFELKQCVFTENADDFQTSLVGYGWNAGGSPQLKGNYRTRDFFSEALMEEMMIGNPIIVDNTQTDPRVNSESYSAVEIHSFVMVPLLRDRKWLFHISFIDNKPRKWTLDEIALMHELTTRIWSQLERARAEEALVSSEEKYRTLFNSIDEGFCLLELVYDEQGEPMDVRYLETNPSFEKHTGIQNVIGRLAGEVLPNQNRWLDAYDNILRTGNPMRTESYNEFTSRWYSAYSFRVSESNKQVAVVFQDITERKLASMKMEENEKLLEQKVAKRTRQIEEKNIELRKINKELEAFTYLSSHDLQEPLRKIRINAGRIAESEGDRLSDKGKDYFNRINDSAQRMQLLIQDLLSFSRVNTSERKYETIDPNKIINDILTELSETIEEKNAVVVTDELCEVIFIPFQFRQLMQNLISNAIKFSKPDRPPRVIIRSVTAKGSELNQESLLPNREYCHISVADNGIGFEKHFSDKVFNVFQRLHSKSEYPGTGIGLAIVKKIVENHNGIITVDSEVDKGTTFNIYIPIL